MKELGKLLPHYKCHKVVQAAKITAINIVCASPEDEIWLHLGELGGVKVPNWWFEKHRPEANGYIVRYKDGYVSWSPKEAFEEGYTIIRDA